MNGWLLTVPTKLLPEIDSSTRFCIEAIDCGIVPVKRLFCSRSTCSASMLPSSLGSEPYNLLLSRFNTIKLLISTSCGESVPPRLLFESCRKPIDLDKVNSSGIVPVRLL